MCPDRGSYTPAQTAHHNHERGDSTSSESRAKGLQDCGRPRLRMATIGEAMHLDHMCDDRSGRLARWPRAHVRCGCKTFHERCKFHLDLNSVLGRIGWRDA